MPEEEGGLAGHGEDGVGSDGVDHLAAAAADGLGKETSPELLPSREPFRTLLHATGLLEQAIGAVLMVVILALVLTQVAQRYLPGQGWAWTGEVARYSMVWAALLLSGYLLAHDRHIAIHVVDYVLRGRALAAVMLLVNSLILVTCLVLLYATYDLIASDIGQVTAAAEIPLKWINVVPLVGFFLTAIRAGLGIVVQDVPALVHGDGGAT